MTRPWIVHQAACLLLGFLAGVACSTSKSSGGGTGSGQLLKNEALPARQRAVLDAWRQGGAAWEIERENVRRDPDLVRFLVDNLVIEMVRAYEHARIAATGQKQGPFERARAELVELQEHSTPMLVQMLSVKDGIVSFLCADTLRAIGARALPDVARLCDDARPETRRRAAELLGDLPHGGEREPDYLQALGRRVEKDPEWIVRGQAAQALGLRGARHEHKGYALGILSRALTDSDPAVGESAAKALGTLGEPRAIPALCEVLPRAASEGRVAEVEAIQKSLARLSGEKKLLDAEGWRAWWRAHEAELIAPKPEPH